MIKHHSTEAVDKVSSCFTDNLIYDFFQVNVCEFLARMSSFQYCSGIVNKNEYRNQCRLCDVNYEQISMLFKSITKNQDRDPIKRAPMLIESYEILAPVKKF